MEKENKGPKVSHKVSHSDISIFINDIAFINFQRKTYIHRQAWKDGTEEGCKYHIEITFTNSQPLQMEFSNKDLWVSILNILSKINIR